MNTDPFVPVREVFTGATHFTEEQWSVVRDAFKVRRLDKKEYLLQPGSATDALYFVSSGCVRVFKLEEDKEITTQFGIRGSCVSDLPGYLAHQPATHYIQALEPTVILQIHRNTLNRLFDEVPPVERFFRIKFEKAHGDLQQRHLENISLTAKQRYDQFRQNYKEIEQRVPQYMIASYLGITREFLSFLRKTS